MAETQPALTNTQVGELIGCTHSMASRLRAGKRLPGLDTLRAIERELDVGWDELLRARDAGADEFGRVFREALAKRAAA